MTNLNYCQVCGAWLGMDDYDGICTKCDVETEEETMPISDTTRALAVAALEHYRRAANHQRYLAGRGFEKPPTVDLMAEIDAALAELEATGVARGGAAVMPDDVREAIEEILDGMVFDTNIDAEAWLPQIDLLHAWLTLQPRPAADAPGRKK